MANADPDKLSVDAFQQGLRQIVRGLFEEARAEGLRCDVTLTHPGTLKNDGTGAAYVDLNEAHNAMWTMRWAMDATEPLVFPTPET